MRNFCDLTDRVAVVVGGTSGLGRAAAVGLAEAGAHVIATGRRENLVNDVATEIEALGRRTIRKMVDCGSRESLDALRDAVLADFGRVDILVNAAGKTAKRATVEVPEAEWDDVLDTNLNGTLRSCQAFYEPLKAAGRGKIVNFASLSSYVSFYQVAAYSVSKTAVLGLTRALGCEWSKDGICVNAVVPGVFPTELNEKLLNGTERGRELIMRTPMGRFGKAEELVGAVVFLASDSASFITGQTITVDGGFLASGVNT
ncbi:MAG: SDR family NAD(P)-dependent oxidoreductase [Candidatus Sumerlaeaceae bacterium]